MHKQATSVLSWLAGKNVSAMTYFVSGGTQTLNSINQTRRLHKKLSYCRETARRTMSLKTLSTAAHQYAKISKRFTVGEWHNIAFDLAHWPHYVTSFTKPELCNALHCHQGTELPLQVTCTESFVKFGRVVFRICSRQTDRQETNKQTRARTCSDIQTRCWQYFAHLPRTK